jgi:hypothetical protein
MYESKLYGEIEAIRSVQDVLKLCKDNIEMYTKSTGKSRSSVWMWRGQSNIEWPLHSSAYRRLSLEKKPREFDMRYYEENLLERATHKGFRWHNGKMLSDFELLAKLQHHGTATRLIDFSRSVLIALWFAVSENVDKDGVLIGFHTDELHGHETELNNETYNENMEILDDTHGPSTWEPTNVSERIKIQSSQFIYSTLSSDKRGSVKFVSDKSLLVMAIKADDKIAIGKELHGMFDIGLETIYPDIDGFSRANSSRIGQWDVYRW